MQDNMKHNNIHIIVIPEGEEEQGIENLLKKVIMENFPNLMREKIKQIQESQRVPIKRNQKRPTSRHIIIKMAKFKNKGRILKAEKKKKKSRFLPFSYPVDKHHLWENYHFSHCTKVNFCHKLVYFTVRVCVFLDDDLFH